MKCPISNGIMDSNHFAISAEGIIPKVAVVRSMRFAYQPDENGNRTEVIDSVRYDCVDPTTFATFTIKVNGAKTIITQKELEGTDDVVYIDIPVELTVIKPYALEYGKAKVSIVAPYVKLHKD